MAQKVQFVETVLRDANQSLIATRLPFEKFEPMLETIDQAGSADFHRSSRHLLYGLARRHEL